MKTPPPAGDTLKPVGGLEEVLTELSPIEDFSGSMSLSFSRRPGNLHTKHGVIS